MQKLFENWRGYVKEPEIENLNEGAFDFLDPFTKGLVDPVRIYKSGKAILLKKKARAIISVARKELLDLYKPNNFKGKTMIAQMTRTIARKARSGDSRFSALVAAIAKQRGEGLEDIVDEWAREQANMIYISYYEGKWPAAAVEVAASAGMGKSFKNGLRTMIKKIPIRFKKVVPDEPERHKEVRTLGVFISTKNGGSKPYGHISLTNKFFKKRESLYLGASKSKIAVKSPEKSTGKEEYSKAFLKKLIFHEFGHAIDNFYQRNVSWILDDLVIKQLTRAKAGRGRPSAAEAGTLSQINMQKIKKVYNSTMRYSRVAKWAERPWEVYASVMEIHYTLKRDVTLEELQDICLIKGHYDKWYKKLAKKLTYISNKENTRELELTAKEDKFVDTILGHRWFNVGAPGEHIMLGGLPEAIALLPVIKKALYQNLVSKSWNKTVLNNNIVLNHLYCKKLGPLSGRSSIPAALNSVAKLDIDTTKIPGQKARRKPIGIQEPKIIAENKILKLKLIL